MNHIRVSHPEQPQNSYDMERNAGKPESFRVAVHFFDDRGVEIQNASSRESAEAESPTWTCKAGIRQM
jgi:hypothetical protein